MPIVESQTLSRRNRHLFLHSAEPAVLLDSFEILRPILEESFKDVSAIFKEINGGTWHFYPQNGLYRTTFELRSSWNNKDAKSQLQLFVNHNQQQEIFPRLVNEVKNHLNEY